MTTPPRHIGVIGSGVAGLTAAYVASRTAHVTLFESDARLGGHADTHVVPSPEGADLRIDTGFIVHNRRTYPTLLRLFAELDIATQPSEMSLSVSDQGTGVEYAGALGARGLFPTFSALRSVEHWRMLASIPRFPGGLVDCWPQRHTSMDPWVHQRMTFRVPRPAQRRPGRWSDPDGRQPALGGLLLQPDLRLLVLRLLGRAGGSGGRGAQHVRRPARLPRAPGRAGSGPDRQGHVRLNVPRRRRAL